MNRRIDALIAAAPFTIAPLEKFYAEGLRTHAYFYVGVAIRASSIEGAAKHLPA